jgi:hypothetical protein
VEIKLCRYIFIDLYINYHNIYTGFRQPTELSNLLPLAEIMDLDRVTNRPYFIISRLSKEVRMIPESPGFTSRERSILMKYVDDLSSTIGKYLIYIKTYI